MLSRSLTTRAPSIILSPPPPPLGISPLPSTQLPVQDTLSRIRLLLSLSPCSTLEVCQPQPLLTCSRATAPLRPLTPCRDTASPPTRLCPTASPPSANSLRLMSLQACQDLTTLQVTACHLSCCTTSPLSRAEAPTPNTAPSREHHNTFTLDTHKLFRFRLTPPSSCPSTPLQTEPTWS